MQALPGSRLDTSLLKEWLLQHLDSLHTYQSHVAAAEAASRQKQHAAAAAAAASAVQDALAAVFQEDNRDDSSAEGPLDAALAQRLVAQNDITQAESKSTVNAAGGGCIRGSNHNCCWHCAVSRQTPGEACVTVSHSVACVYAPMWACVWTSMWASMWAPMWALVLPCNAFPLPFH